ncbi:MAG: hypothetical protein WBQ02_04335, partial [Terracidiphilus sp.]
MHVLIDRQPSLFRDRVVMTIAIGAAAMLLSSLATAQDGSSFQFKSRPSKPAAPSNAALASPAVERRVDELLRQMTIEEKVGQLVQYSGDGYIGADEAAVRALWPSPGKNPEP